VVLAELAQRFEHADERVDFVLAADALECVSAALSQGTLVLREHNARDQLSQVELRMRAHFLPLVFGALRARAPLTA
jgi:hypothetical protein